MEKKIDMIINEYRNKKINGTFIDLIPMNKDILLEVINLRNHEKNKYFLNQKNDLTYDTQLKWFEEYEKRKNDIYWGIYNKDNVFIGTIRIYDIDREKNICDQGSFMIDEKYALDAPYAVEAEILSLDFVFNILGIDKVINEDREDNKVMNSLSKKIGFDFVKNTIINEINYNYYILLRENYLKNKSKFIKLINSWKNR